MSQLYFAGKMPYNSEMEKADHLPQRAVYISPTKGTPRELLVQRASQGIVSDAAAMSTLRTCGIKSMGPSAIRLGTWPFRHTRIAMICLFIPFIICPWLSLLLLMKPIVSAYLPMTTDEDEQRNPYEFDEFRYEFNIYAQVSVNEWEDQIRAGRPPALHATIQGQRDPIANAAPTEAGGPMRQLRPRANMPRQLMRICEDGRHEPLGTDSFMKANDARDATQKAKYLFVSHVAGQWESPKDKDALFSYAGHVAQAHDLQYYWTTECLKKNSPNDRDDDTYAIADYVRGAEAVLIVVGRGEKLGPLSDDPSTRRAQKIELLAQWGERVWTFPEALLAEKLYITVRDDVAHDKISLPALVESAWIKNSQASGQLADHFAGSITLSHLELVTAALEAFQARSIKSYREGDRTYALMGLLNNRPEVDPSDSDFTAFARLSLANNSDALLERLLCIAPQHPDQRWYEMGDAWNSKLWQIQPSVHVTGIGKDDTVILTNVRAAAVRWKGFRKTQVSFPGLLGTAWLGFIGLFAAICFPWYGKFIERLAKGEVPGIDDIYKDQFTLVGFEGHMPIDEIEAKIYGASTGALSWTPFASPLSQHGAVQPIEQYKHYRKHPVPLASIYEGIDPWNGREQEIRQLAEQTRQRIFTLVNTATGEVTLFLARRPPVAFLVCGQEGGRKRVIGVSYNREIQAVFRETVLRLEPSSVGNFPILDRVRLGFSRDAHTNFTEYVNPPEPAARRLGKGLLR